MSRGNFLRTIFLTGLILTLFFFFNLPAGLEAQEKQEDRPERGIAIYTEYSGLFVSPGEPVRMELTVDNKGKTDENIALKLSKIPQGWKASIRGPEYLVNDVPVPGRKNRILTFLAEPGKGVKPGTYLFQIDAQTEDGKFTSLQKITVTMGEKAPVAEDIQVTTSYPVLRGQNDTQFEFSLQVANKSESDRNFNLSAQAPDQWEINFKPAYEPKQISSLRIQGNQSQTLTVSATPPKDSPAGSYPIVVGISSSEKKAEAKLTVVITGTYKLEAQTSTGRLSLEAFTGKSANISFYVKNTGSAANRNITFNSLKPENWKVEYKPEKIEALEPGAFAQVEEIVTPAAQALVGDYNVSTLIEGEKASSNLGLRVTVKTSSAWGWIGAGIIGIVILGLSGLFLWLGRR